MYNIHPSPLVAVLKAVLSEIVYGCFENHHNYCKDVLCKILEDRSYCYSFYTFVHFYCVFPEGTRDIARLHDVRVARSCR